MKAVIGRHLWELVVCIAQLPSHLAALRNYAMLGRGEMFQLFVEHSLSLMRLPPKAHAEAGVSAVVSRR